MPTSTLLFDTNNGQEGKMPTGATGWCDFQKLIGLNLNELILILAIKLT
jgi:hypothetical protein